MKPEMKAPTEGILREESLPSDTSLESHHCLTSHAYMAVPPVAGSLWIFPGRTPHAVMGQCSDRRDAPQVLQEQKAQEDASEQQSDTQLMNQPPLRKPFPRISVAINFLDAMPPPPVIAVG